eukprot:192221_1
METVGTDWLKLAPFPKPTWSCYPSILNQHEFAFWSYKYVDNSKVTQYFNQLTYNKFIYKYNTHQNKWVHWIKIPYAYDTFIVSFNKDNNKYYRLAGLLGNSYEASYNLKSDNNDSIWSKCEFHATNTGSKIVFIDNQVHIIGGSGSHGNKHFINGTHSDTFPISGNSYQNFGMVYLKSKQLLLCMGGRSQKGILNELYFYSVAHKMWSWNSSLTDIQTIRLPVGLFHFGCVASKNEKYVIIFGGKTCDYIDSDTIYILNMDTKNWMKCNIACPVKGLYYAVNMSDEQRHDLLCVGYINDVWKSPSICSLVKLPLYLINIIKGYYNNEYIHLIERYGDHWKIPLDNIIMNICI